MTFSIVAFDPDTGGYGIAVASRYLAAGSTVPAAASDAGAVATQARTNAGYRQAALAALRAGHGAKETLERLLDADPGRQARQVGIVDRDGTTVTWTGDECGPYAGGRTGTGYAVLGNLLTGPQVLDAMVTAWRGAEPGRPLARRLLAALAAGDAAGGDRRGRQSAALLVVRPDADYCIGTDQEVDLRVDDAPRPIDELSRLLDVRYRQDMR